MFGFSDLVGKADFISILVEVKAHAGLSPTAVWRDAEELRRLFLEFATGHCGNCQSRRSGSRQDRREEEHRPSQVGRRHA
ncbi:hypothetical protein ELH39_36710 [Rhizobium ruizarguesonis]|nr:hypothetical protein ELH61_37585 [Rhizobium ruizarguesonis]TBB62038.1 hypothetical protein ELH45_32780 [Rhizobium ruizarguesonis]TBB81125.1 hypothetical protein ELH39_36710 [Rhizobium ruizarguesonis]TBC26144.1 hypothetical protein ELH33_26525 [Rhizobium ruizarguesonis]